MQVFYALSGKGIACGKCKKYHSKTISHTKNRDCSKTTYRINFATLNDGNYFCYFGCCEFEKLEDLKIHLLEIHQFQAHDWGIDINRLRMQIDHKAALNLSKSLNDTPGGEILGQVF